MTDLGLFLIFVQNQLAVDLSGEFSDVGQEDVGLRFLLIDFRRVNVVAGKIVVSQH